MPTYDSDFTHRKQNRKVQQFSEAATLLNGNGAALAIYFDAEVDTSLLTAASLNGATPVTGKMTCYQDPTFTEPATWFTGRFAVTVSVPAGAGGATLTSAVANHINFNEGVAAFTITPSGVWVASDTLRIVPTGAFLSETLAAGTHYDNADLTFTAVA